MDTSVFHSLTGNISDWSVQIIFCLRIIASAMCGCLIGYERSRRLKGAGVRTHMIIALSSTLMMLISKYGFFDMRGIGINADASRIAAQIVTGIPFLGAGVIYIRKNQSSVQGLTTAAGILATCGIGMAWGSGLYIIAIFATLLLMLLQFVLHKILTGYDSTFVGEVIFVANVSFDAEGLFHQIFDDFSVSIQKCRIKRLEDGMYEFRLNFKAMHDISAQVITKAMETHPEIAAIEV